MELTQFNTAVMAASVFLPGTLAVLVALSDKYPSRARKKVASLLAGIAFVGTYIVLLVLRATAWATMYQTEALAGQKAVNPVFWGYVPDALLSLFVALGLISFGYSGWHFWRSNQEYKKWNDMTHESVVPAGSVNPDL